MNGDTPDAPATAAEEFSAGGMPDSEPEAAGSEAGASGSERALGSLGPEARLDIDPLLDDPGTRIVVCCGSGGVGKTTTAAALGVRAAERGRKAVVLTIDPARRLAQSMGLDELDNVPRRVPGVGGRTADGSPAGHAADGELHAMMLDMKRTFDEIVESHADAERARAILDNPFYQSLSAGFAGTQEYMAMEKLGQLRAQDEWDLIIVDTPPSRSALDFLDAPKRLGSFLDGKFIRLLMAPAKAGGKAGMKFVNLGMAGLSLFTGALNKLLGAGLLRDVQTFVAAMDTMFGGFRTRADATYRLLQSPGTAFLVVAAPERDALREAAYFVERLAAESMPLAGLVLNRVHTSRASRLGAERALAAAENLQEGCIVDRTPGQGEEHSAPTAGTGGLEASGVPGCEDSEDGSPTGQAPSPEPHEASGASGEVSVPGTRTGSGDGPGPATDSGQPGSPTPEHRIAAGLLRIHAERMQLLTRERRMCDRFSALHPEVPVAEVGALPSDVHDLAGLRTIGERLAQQSDAAQEPSGGAVPASAVHAPHTAATARCPAHGAR